jgi:hypothetical protein
MAIEGQQFSIAPNSALFERLIGSASGSPGLFPRWRVYTPFGENHFEQTSPTSSAIIDRFVDRKARAAVLLKTRQLS